jgi:outer membrane protein assembly factor BamB
LKFFKFLFLILLSLAIGACGPVKDFQNQLTEVIVGQDPIDPPAPLKDIKTIIQPKLIWKVSLKVDERFDLSPVASGEYVYAASSDGILGKYNLTTGKSLWEIKTEQIISGGLGFGSDFICFGTPNGYVYSYDINGKLLWKSKVSSVVLSAPVVVEDTVLVRTMDNNIHAFALKDGAKKWTYNRQGPALTLRSNASLISSDGVIYVGYPGGKLAAIRLDNGTLLWESSIAQPKGITEVERIADITSQPVIDGMVIYAVAYNGRIAAVDRINGRVIWNRDISSFVGMNIEAGRIYLSHAGGAVYSLDNTSGKTFWRQGDLLNRRLSKPLPMSEYIVVGDLAGVVHILDRETGAFLGRIELEANATSTFLDENNPVMSNMIEYEPGKLLAQTRNGGLYAISVK